ncbi:MAG: glycosyltransferase family 4 protein [Pseudomonadota bacterium]
MARLLQKALQGAGAQHDVTLVSQLRSYDGRGEANVQTGVFKAAQGECDRLRHEGPFDLWVSYHNYYKAPDLLGPVLSKHWSVPYVLFEATRARKRLTGPWARFAKAAEAANDTADLIFHFTDHDGVALHEQRAGQQQIAPLAPFLDQADVTPLTSDVAACRRSLLTVGMMRGPDKRASYARLAEILRHVKTEDWHLTVIGDGPLRSEIEAMFAPLRARVTFAGQFSADQLAEAYRATDLFLWPGVNEAYGMVYLEAQAAGVPALAEDRPGVRNVLPKAALLALDDPRSFAARIDLLLTNDGVYESAARDAHRLVQQRHLFPRAQEQIFRHIDPLLKAL